MRMAPRPGRSSLEQRRDDARRRRAAAGTFAESFPEVERLRLELNFVESEGPSPVRQLHELFPAAAAVLEFSCPHGDCDGLFDITERVANLLREGASAGAGVFECRGARSAPGMTRRSCTLQLGYRLVVTYRAMTR